MIDEDQVIEALGSEPAGDGLDPDRVIAGAHRRRTRHRLAGAASVIAAVTAVACFVALGGLGITAGDGPVSRTSTAGTPPTGSPSPSLSLSTEPAPYGFDPYQPPKTFAWKPYGAVGARPIGRIPANRWVQILPDYWLATVGTSVCRVGPTRNPGPLPKPSECIPTIGNTNFVKGLHNMSSLGRWTTSVFEGDLRRVLYTAYDGFIEATLYRFDAIPGWMLAAGRLPDSLEPPAQSVFGYDAKNRLRAKFTAVDSYPKPINDPLHQR